MAKADALIEEALRRMQAGALSEAETILDRVLRAEPRNPRALCIRGIAAAERQDAEAAIKYVEKALAIGPNMPGVLNNAATMAAKFGNVDRALELWTCLTTLDPNFPTTYFNLAICHGKRGDLEAAVDCQRKGLALEPSNQWGYSNLGNYLKDAGRISEAVAAFKEGIQRNPGNMDLHCNLAYSVHFDPAFSLKDIFEENRAWARKFSDHLPAPEAFGNDPSPDRKLRIGYISPNFRDHSESYFILPLFRGINPESFETYVYSVGNEDKVTDEFKKYATRWYQLKGIPDAQLASRIREDQIDILVDFTQHMAYHRLLVFARKPAPVQMIWLAYPSTSGLTQMDYRITDPYLETGGTEFNSEKSWFLEKSYWCYEVIGPRPDFGMLPADSNGFITFGCLNHHGKVTPVVLDAWRKILKSVPNSRLVLLVTFKSVEENLKSFFAEEGIDPDRIECQPRLDRQAYMEAYNRIDITLDPFPYNGATTTCDALWMGVPVISWAGETPVSRAGWSIMSNIGLPDLVGFSQAEYIQKAISLAEDLPRLRELRASLRSTLENSPVMDASLFGEAMGKAYRAMWREWCDQANGAGV